MGERGWGSEDGGARMGERGWGSEDGGARMGERGWVAPACYRSGPCDRRAVSSRGFLERRSDGTLSRWPRISLNAVYGIGGSDRRRVGGAGRRVALHRHPQGTRKRRTPEVGVRTAIWLAGNGACRVTVRGSLRWPRSWRDRSARCSRPRAAGIRAPKRASARTGRAVLALAVARESARLRTSSRPE
jgi:hypothetical protein